MNFFERQDQARRKTALLIAYFIAAIILIIVAVTLCIWLVMGIGGISASSSWWDWVQTPTFWKLAAGTALVILGGSLVQHLQLRSGGEAVAQMVNARPIPLDSQHPDERRLINVVEEIAIASGVALPRLYVMDRERGINAFVAGYQPDQAVMVVTKGALEQLTRDELQGVVGHEFSHILNGDMRLNIHLVSVLAGILLIGQIGEFLLRSTRNVGRSKDSAKAVPVLVIGGLGLTLIGYVGLFFGRLIKAAVSRQREYLADAASVQFTRNPTGLASALDKIRTASEGSLLSRTLHAENLSHMCFGETVRLRFNSLFATHPPLEQRIRAIDPLFMTHSRIRRNQQRIQERRQPKEPQAAAATQALHPSQFQSAGIAALARTAPDWTLVPLDKDSAKNTELPPNSALNVSDLAGLPQAEHFDYAEQLLASWPEELFNHAHTPGGAMGLIGALLILQMPASDLQPAVELLRSKEAALGMDYKALQWGLMKLPDLGRPSALPLIELCLGSLKTLNGTQREAFLASVRALIALDKKCSLFEFVVFSILRKQLATQANRATHVRFHSFKPVQTEIQKVLAVLARAGSTNREQMERAYSAIISRFGQQTAALPPSCTLTELAQALERLAALTPLLKGPFLQSCADLVMYDGKQEVEEYEILRTIAESLDCPMPAMSPKQ